MAEHSRDAANLVQTPGASGEQLAQGIQGLVLGRPLLIPHWADKAEQGKAGECHCINCLYRLESMMEGAHKGEHGHCP